MDVQLHFPMSGFPIRGASSKGFWFPPEMILAGSLEMHYLTYANVNLIYANGYACKPEAPSLAFPNTCHKSISNC